VAKRKAAPQPAAQAAARIPEDGSPKGGSVYDEHLIVVGTGIRVTGQLTVETIACMQRADAIFYLVSDPVGEEVIKRFCPEGAQTLYDLYGEGKPRIETYHAMVDRILASVRDGKRTVAAFYGHPGVFAFATHESIRRARAEGYRARMLPGVSAEDCLIADLGVDPAVNGMQSYEATDFLVNSRVIDNSSQLILWQAGVLGDWTFRRYGYDTSAMPLLLEKLLRYYPPTHTVYVYEAPTAPCCEPMIRPIALPQILNAGLTSTSTLYFPPGRAPVPDPVFLSRMRVPQG
jgi:hypothetical protein